MQKTNKPESKSEAAPNKSRVTNALFSPTDRFYLDPRSPVPLYHQMEQIILERIGKEKAAGRMLPRELDLIEIFGVSRATVKKVTENLVAKGLIERKRAVGTRIVQSGVTEDLGRMASFTEQMEKRGLTVSTEMLDVELHVPSEKLREQLNLAENEKTLCIRRLRGTNEIFPVVLLRSEIPAVFGIDPKEDFSGSLYRLIENKYRTPILWGEEKIWASNANRSDAELLRIKQGDAVLVMERVAYTHDAKPVEFVRAVYRADCYQFSLRLKR